MTGPSVPDRRETPDSRASVIHTPDTAFAGFPPNLLASFREPVLLGRGGFAKVFRARRNRDGRLVALKIPISFDEATGRAFIKEIRVWEDLKHENIVECYGCNIMPVPYLELEYMEGGSLEALDKPLSVQEAARICLGIARGLACAHGRQPEPIVHRDLKPANVLLSADMTPKITDWGLSKIASASGGSSGTGFSPAYASPEQISPGKFGGTDTRTDIYQLGVILYELVTGKPPFTGEDIGEIMFNIVSQEPEAPSRINPGAAVLEPIIIKCMAKKKEHRFQNVRQVQTELSRYLRQEYSQSLESSRHDPARSAYYCGQLLLLHLRLGQLSEAVQFAERLVELAGHDSDVIEFVDELKYRRDRRIDVNEDLIVRASGIMGRMAKR